MSRDGEAVDPPAVRTAVMIQRWRRLTFLHWRYPPEVIQALLPDGLRVHTFDGSAWVGLVPFEMSGIRPTGAPPVPWLSRFPETNVRTYVRGSDGADGVWFLTLEATRLAAVLAARLTLGLPYRWAAASIRRDGRVLRYQGRRRWPEPAGVGYRLRVRVGDAIGLEDRAPLDDFLTARFRLYATRPGGRLVTVPVEHPPWPLYRGGVEELNQDLLPSLGLPSPDGPPLVHMSPGVRVRIGPPRTIASEPIASEPIASELRRKPASRSPDRRGRRSPDRG